MANAKKTRKEKKNRQPIGPKAYAKHNLATGYKHPSLAASPEPLFGKGKRMRSAAVAVGIIGLFGYAAWPRTDVQRNSYASKEDCEHDYATGQCSYDEGKQGNSSHSSGYHYYGPWYRSDWRTNPVQGDPGPGRTFASGSSSGASSRGPTGFDFGSRGGFGSTGRVSARGG